MSAPSPIYFFDGGPARVLHWHPAKGDVCGHYATDPKAGTMGEALEIVSALIGQRKHAVGLVELYGQALAEIARTAPDHPAGVKARETLQAAVAHALTRKAG